MCLKTFSTRLLYYSITRNPLIPFAIAFKLGTDDISFILQQLKLNLCFVYTYRHWHNNWRWLYHYPPKSFSQLCHMEPQLRLALKSLLYLQELNNNKCSVANKQLSVVSARSYLYLWETGFASTSNTSGLFFDTKIRKCVM